MQILVAAGTRRVAQALGGLAFAVAFIVVMLLPRRPIDEFGWALYLASVTFFALVLFATGKAILQVQRKANSNILAKALAALLAVFPGLCFVWLVFHFADKIVPYFR